MPPLDIVGALERKFGMASLRKLLLSSRWADPILLTLLGGVWVWKMVETAGRHAHLLRRNLGWGYVVDLTIPIGISCALGVFFVVRRIVGRQG